MNSTYLTTLTVETLKEELGSGLQNVEIPCPDMIMVKSVTGYGVHAKSILEPMQEWLSGEEKKIVKNGSELIEKMYGRVKIDEAGEEKIHALINEVDTLLKNEEMQMEFCYQQVEEAKDLFVNSRNSLFRRHAEEEAYEKYRNLLGVCFKRQLKVFMYQHMQAMLANMKAALSC